ncbi:MAG: TIGR03936 family radical SAM-associated protein [Candidatus Ancaeobacter aquaticus]|nr:TIGR03936 family radical SAM-associated protein [Candidatus Ancaeobacter aquaticus]
MSESTIRLIYSVMSPFCLISHLDLMRTIFRGFMRADIPIALSQGFSPHQVISFGPPLSVGMEGENEFLDFRIMQFCDLKKMANRLQCSFANILHIKDIHYFDQEKDIVTKEIDCYEYCVKLKNNDELDKKHIEEMLGEKEVITKTNARGTSRTMLVKPMVPYIDLKKDQSGTLLTLKLILHEGNSINPYDLIKYLLDIDRHKARGYQVKRINMYSIKTNKKVYR